MIKYLQQRYAIDTATTPKYFPALNGVKGIIIMMIVITHCLPDSMILFFMYLFHMPVFLAMSGFLLKQSAFEKGGKAYAKKIFHRLLIPWLIASVIYIPFQLINEPGHFGPANLFYPYYHLWYIPAYIIGSVICYYVFRFKIPALPVVLLTAALTIIWYLVFRDNQLSVSEQPFYWLGEKRFYAYLFFFVVGFSFRNQLLQLKPSLWSLLFINVSSLILLVFCVYGSQPDWISVIPYMFFNFSLVILLLQYIAPLPIFQHKLFLMLNKQSLGVYLYHPMIIMIIYQLMHDPAKKSIGKSGGFVVGIFTIACIILFVHLLKRWQFTSRYFLGNIRNEAVK